MRTTLFLALAFAAGCAHAAPARKPARLGLCAACHGEDGRARVPGAPNLAGQNVDYLLNALHDYKTDARNVAVMRAATGPLSETEMQQLAHWYASLPCAPSAPAH
ncbi:MAG: c-type cytochrome [Rhodanobacteraceae bacterium]